VKYDLWSLYVLRLLRSDQGHLAAKKICRRYSFGGLKKKGGSPKVITKDNQQRNCWFERGNEKLDLGKDASDPLGEELSKNIRIFVFERFENSAIAKGNL